MNSQETRGSFLRYFERRGHRIVSSSPLVPHDDPTLLFTNAGMNQFKDVFLGRERRDYLRATTSQKCMRVSGKHNDLENVGPSLRHHTFFEMLGNFSFGDYFKKDAIAFAWELLTEVWKLPPDRLWATVFAGEGDIPRDVEAREHWLRFVPADRIAELGAADNFWSMGDTGPCGRCSEIHYFRGPEFPCSEPVCLGVACSCDRFIEIWNIVFMEFDRQSDGTRHPLPAPSIDTGMGLERITAVLQETLSNYDTDIFRPVIDAITSLTGVSYGPHGSGQDSHASDVSIRVIADHIRAMTFLIADGVVPSNEWRGYVLRKIMRRAMRHGKKLSMREPFLFELVDVLVKEMGQAYPELGAGRDAIRQVIRAEEERFDAVLNDGLPRLEALIQETVARGNKRLPGDQAFRLYDTYGLPLDFIDDVVEQAHLELDREAFDSALEGQRQKARAGSAFDAKKSDDLVFHSDKTRQALQSAVDQFEGYTSTQTRNVPILAVFDEQLSEVDQLVQGQVGFIALARTPFYVEAGGQVSDVGRISAEDGSGSAVVEDVVRASHVPRLHRVRVDNGRLRADALVHAAVNSEVRDSTRRNHTATHLLHAALRQVLGPHVKQAGSLVAPDRLRFDFVHFSALTKDELERIERLVNEQIVHDAPVDTTVKSTDEAIASGAMALFGEKYGDRVRVVSVPGFSVELCGGTHVDRTGQIGAFVITAEEGVAAGVRRIEALTGLGAVARHQFDRAHLTEVTRALNVPAGQVVDAVSKLQSDVRRLAREVTDLKLKAAAGSPREDAAAEIATVDGVKLLARRADGLEKAAMRALSDTLRDRLKSGVLVLAGSADGKVSIVVSVSKDLTDRVHAGQIVKQIAPIVGGGGGGRPDFAEAGGKDPSKIDALLDESRKVVERMLESTAPAG